MLDNVGLELDSVCEVSYHKILENLGVERPRESNKMRAMWKNMQLLYFPDSKKLVIQNSLHKLYNALNSGSLTNANDFNFAEMHFLSEWLSKVYFERPIEDFKLTRRVEFGFNISTSHIPAIDVVNLWLSIKMHPFYMEPPRNKGQKPLQKTCYFCDYKVKVYDKAKQEGITTLSTKNILRYEIAIEQPRKWEKIFNIKGASLKDINEHETWEKMYSYLLRTYDSIAKIPLIDKDIPLDDIYVSYSYLDGLMANTIRHNLNKSSYKRQRQKAKELYNKFDKDDSNIHNIIRERIKNKFIELM